MPQPSVLVVDDEELIRWSLERDLTREGYTVRTAPTGADALRLQHEDPADVVLLDIGLPDGDGLRLIAELLTIREDAAVIMISSANSVESAVQALRLGALDYFTKPFDLAKLHHGISMAVERVGLRLENRTLRARARLASDSGIVAEAEKTKAMLALAARVMTSDSATVLLLGESGVGKDLIARHIHDGSPRADRLFLDINCAALPEALLESELFGHERGAFTDAKAQKPGLFELATGGTVYLDEIADAPLSVQAKLLKVLEQRTFRRLGGVRDITTDARLIAATSRNLEDAVAQQRMRVDLYYRLKVFPIHIAPLRERSEDVLPIARAFVARYARSFGKDVPGFDEETAEHLLAYRWPGNVRELRNVVERAMILAEPGAPLGVELLPPELAEGALGGGVHGAPLGALADGEARLIREALSASGGNQSRAAARLGISRGALARKMRRLGIVLPKPDG